MVELLEGKRGELLRFGKGARNWLIAQLIDDKDILMWSPPEGGRSVSEMVSHLSWALSAVTMKIADDFKIDLESTVNPTGSYFEELKGEILAAYEVFENLLRELSDDDLEKTTTLPPPARIREGSIERVLRIMAIYHVIHHAGQVAQVIRRAKSDLD